MRPVFLHLPHTPDVGVRPILKLYYGETHVLDETTEELADFLVNEPERFNDYLAFAGPFRRDDFQNFDPRDVDFFSIVVDPVVRAWREFSFEPQRNTFEHWLKYDSRPNVLCHYLTGFKDAVAADFQNFVRLTNFKVCELGRAHEMLKALGRLHGWNRFHSALFSRFLEDPHVIAPETPEIDGRARELVETYHPQDCAAFRWLFHRTYTF